MKRSASGAVDRSTEEPSSSITSRRLVRTRSESVWTTIPASTLRQLVEQRELVGDAAVRPPGGEPPQRFLLADGADPAGHALAARLVAEERGDPEHGVGEVGRLVEDHHDARAQGRADGARVLER